MTVACVTVVCALTWFPLYCRQSRSSFSARTPLVRWPVHTPPAHSLSLPVPVCLSPVAERATRAGLSPRTHAPRVSPGIFPIFLEFWSARIGYTTRGRLVVLCVSHTHGRWVYSPPPFSLLLNCRCNEGAMDTGVLLARACAQVRLVPWRKCRRIEL